MSPPLRAMPLLKGPSMHARRGLVRSACSILLALAAMHAQGLCHGHVTPGRIMFQSAQLTANGAATAKLCYLENIRGPAGGASAHDKDTRQGHRQQASCGSGHHNAVCVGSLSSCRLERT